MGDLADVKRQRMVSFLRWLEKKENITVEDGGCHQYNIQHSAWPRPFPIPFKHNGVNKHIVKRLMKMLVSAGVCTEEEFREKIT